MVENGAKTSPTRTRDARATVPFVGASWPLKRPSKQGCYVLKFEPLLRAPNRHDRSKYLLTPEDGPIRWPASRAGIDNHPGCRQQHPAAAARIVTLA